jgi:hypothetical protein
LINGERLTNEQLAKNLNKSVGGKAITQNDPSANSNSSSLQPLSISEIKHLLRKLDTTKATSFADFPTWASKEGMEDICIPLYSIINSMLATGQYPDFWKRAQISPIPKTKHPTVYKDFRPISLLFHLGKIAEEVIINKLKHQLLSVIQPNQYAYLPNLSTTDAILQLLDDCTSELDKAGNKYIQLACLDFSKAFDKLQPAILLNKLNHYKINVKIINILDDFLKRRQQCVRVGNATSDYIDISVGAPQGTRLGPILWLFYINDLTAHNFNVVKYADDTSFYTTIRNPSTESVAPAILHTQSWSEENSMALNTEKTMVINISLNQRTKYQEPVIINDALHITPCEAVKFLGVFIDRHLTFSTNVDHVVSKANSRLYFLRQLKIFGMDSCGLRIFYCSNIRTILSYASPAWYFLLSDKDKERLEKVQRTATRIILPELDYFSRLSTLNLLMLSDFIFDLSQSLFNRIANNPKHPLHSRITINTCRTSSRCPTTYRTRTPSTTKRTKSLFYFFMSCSNT